MYMESNWYANFGFTGTMQLTTSVPTTGTINVSTNLSVRLSRWQVQHRIQERELRGYRKPLSLEVIPLLMVRLQDTTHRP